MSDATMTLRCVSCGTVERRPLEECATGDRNPECRKCHGIMVAVSVQERMAEDPELMRAFAERAKDYLDLEWALDPRPAELVARRGRVIPVSEWRWFGHPAHLIVAEDCRFHLATLIGDVLVSTVGEYLPDSQVREVLTESRGVTLEGRGDDRRHDYMRKIGYEEIGVYRKFETMVFRVTGEVCTDPECGCGLPRIDPSDLDFSGYNNAGDATRGHYAMCEKWAKTDG